jgi:hypothetical protein
MGITDIDLCLDNTRRSLTVGGYLPVRFIRLRYRGSEPLPSDRTAVTFDALGAAHRYRELTMSWSIWRPLLEHYLEDDKSSGNAEHWATATETSGCPQASKRAPLILGDGRVRASGTRVWKGQNECTAW